MIVANDKVSSELMRDIERVITGLNEAEAAHRAKMGWEFTIPDRWFAKIKGAARKYVYIDVGSSGAFLCEMETGELYNIKGYGTPDKNKKLKADIGNIATVDPAWLHGKRYNYLR